MTVAGEENKASAAEQLARAQQAVRDAKDAADAQAARDECVAARKWQERVNLIFPDDED